MAQRLPIPGSDNGTWGSILNGFLEVSHNADGTLSSAAVTQAGAATLSSPAFIGTPTAPTASPGTNTTQLATTAFTTTAVGALSGQYVPTSTGVTRAGGTTATASGAIAYKVADYGLVADNGTTDNAPLLTAMLAAIPEGSIVEWETNNTSYYEFGSTVTITKSYTFRGNWNRDSSGGAPYGTILRPTSASVFAPLNPMFTITTGRVIWEGVAIIGDYTSETAGTTNGTTTLQLSSVTAASWMVGCPISGTNIPQLATGTTTITAVNTGLNQVTINNVATGSTSGTAAFIIWSGIGIQYGAGSHASKGDRMLITSFGINVDYAANSDHITFERSEITGGYDNIVYDTGNQFDYGFIDTVLTGAAHSCERLVTNTSVVNVSHFRCHRGFSPWGVTQDTTSNGSSYEGFTDIATPTEQVTSGHINIVNGGNMFIDPSSYWVWSGTPSNPAFSISGLQNSGPIYFGPYLQGTNANCPYVFFTGGQNGNQFYWATSLGTFAQLAMQYKSYTTMVVPGQANFTGAGITTGSTTVVTLNGYTEFNSTMFLHSVSKTAAYSTTSTTDLFVRCTANSWTLTLTQTGYNQLIYVTNEGAGTITMTVSAGSYFGPATIASGHGATFVSDSVNWRCVGSY